MSMLTSPLPYTLATLRARRGEIEQIARRRGASNIRVFGSVALGTAQPESDIDLLVDLDPGVGPAEVCGIATELEDALGYRVDVYPVLPETAYRDPAGAAMLEHVIRSSVTL